MNVRSKLQYVLAVASVYAGSALAEVPAAVTTAIDGGLADGKTIAYALLAFAISIGVIMYIKRKAA